jgi:hypothetical protein
MNRKATKKPIEIEYMTFDDITKLFTTSNGLYDLSREINGHKITMNGSYNGVPTLYLIKTLEGFHEMTKSDVLIIGIKGEIYPCKKDIFDLTYDYERDN